MTAKKTIERYLIEDRNIRPRAFLKKLFLNKSILINGKAAKRTDSVGPNDTVELLNSENIYSGNETESILPNKKIKIKILSETKDWLLTYKPAGLHAHPQRKGENDTVLNALVATYPECAEPARPERPLEGLLVHRIDQGTSGALLCARSLDAFGRLRKTWESGSVTKIYLAWVDGALERPGTVSCFLAHDQKSKKKMKAFEEPKANHGGKLWPAVTSFFPVTRVRGRTLALIQIHTGVTHQIRVTLAALGHGVIGDPVYKPYAKPLALDWVPLTNKQLALFESLKKKLRAKKRDEAVSAELPENAFFLHAFYLALENSSESFEVVARPPEYF